MSALAARTGLEDATATNASGEATLLALFDFVAQRLAAGTAGAGVASAAELLLARNSLGLGAGADVASAATLNLTSVTAQIMGVTGTVAVSAVSINNGQTAVLIPAAALPLTYHATNNPVQGGQNYTCEVGDVVIYWKDNSGVLHNQIVTKDGLPVVDVMQLSGNQTAAGIKTFSSAPVLSAGAKFGSALMPNLSTTAPLFAARAFGVFDGRTTGTFACNNSDNVTSVQRIAAGSWVVTLATGFPDTNFVVVANCFNIAAWTFCVEYSANRTANSFQLNAKQEGSGLVDCSHVSFAVFRT